MSTTVTPADVLKVARSQIGYEETGGSSGHDGNVTKYWTAEDPSLQGASWCAAFVSWVFARSKAALPDIDRKYGYINCADAVRWAKANGHWNQSGRYCPAWTIFYCFDGSGVADHTGIVVSDDGVNLHTIEGNTLPQNGGNQADGGGVYAKVRPHGAYVLGCIDTYGWLLYIESLKSKPASKPRGLSASTRKALLTVTTAAQNRKGRLSKAAKAKVTEAIRALKTERAK